MAKHSILSRRFAAIILSFTVVTASGIVGRPVSGQASSGQLISDLQAGELQQAVNKHADVFGGLWGDPESHVLTIDLADESVDSLHKAIAMKEIAIVGTRADRKILSRPKHWTVRFLTSGPSLATLDAIGSKVTTAQPWASDVGDSLVGWAIDPRVHAVVIGLTSITPKYRADAAKAFGALAELTIEQRPILQDRYLDSQPYYGSDHITLSSVSSTQCTAGFEAYDPNAGSHHGFLTAGHCYAPNTIVLQGYVDGTNHLHQTGNIGKVTRQSFSNGQADVEFMDAAAVGTNVSDFVWRGPNPPTGVTKPSGTGTSFIGLTVCFDGAVTTENCHAVVQLLNDHQIISGVDDYYLMKVTSNNGSVLGRVGDSGGPVFKDDGFGGLTAYGNIAGGTGTTEWYTDITAELNALNVGLVVN